MEHGEVCGIEILKEKIKVKIKDGEDFLYKTYDYKDLKILKNVEKKDIQIEIKDEEELKELKKLEDLEKAEKQNNNNNDNNDSNN